MSGSAWPGTAGTGSVSGAPGVREQGGPGVGVEPGPHGSIVTVTASEPGARGGVEGAGDGLTRTSRLPLPASMLAGVVGQSVMLGDRAAAAAAAAAAAPGAGVPQGWEGTPGSAGDAQAPVGKTAEVPVPTPVPTGDQGGTVPSTAPLPPPLQLPLPLPLPLSLPVPVSAIPVVVPPLPSPAPDGPDGVVVPPGCGSPLCSLQAPCLQPHGDVDASWAAWRWLVAPPPPQSYIRAVVQEVWYGGTGGSKIVGAFLH